jgi:ABC-2 type transport system permease protein
MFFKARMEYRFSFFSGMVANFYCYFITYITFWVIVQKFGSINGWLFDDMAILYGLNLLTYCITGMFFWEIFGLEKEITSGNLDSYLVRPMGIIKQLICKRFADTFIGQFIVTLIFMIIAFAGVQSIMSPLKYLYLIVAIFSGVFIHAGAMIILGSLSFWMNRSLQLADLLYYDLRTFINYPLSVFPAFIKIALTYILPWAFINYYPAMIILDKIDSTESMLLGFISPVVGILVFSFSLFIFNRGLRRYSGSGS